MLEDKLYKSDYFNIYVCQTYRTKYNKIKEQYHKELCIYLDFESDIFNYLFVALTYKKKKNTFFTEYHLNSEIPYDNFHYYANETQKAIEECDIIEWMKDYKKGRNNNERC